MTTQEDMGPKWARRGHVQGTDKSKKKLVAKKIQKFLTFRDLRNSRFSDFSLFSRIWKNNSFKIEFSMKNDPIRFNFQVSTTFRRGVNRVKTKKFSAFYPKLTYTLPRKSVGSYENYDFSTFYLFFEFERMIHRKSNSPWKMTPYALIFRSLRLFGGG